MNKNIMKMYVWILKEGGRAKVERIKDGVYGISLLKDMPDAFYFGTKTWSDRKFFYLYPRNPYTGEFCDE